MINNKNLDFIFIINHFWGRSPGTTPRPLSTVAGSPRSLLVLLLSHQFDLQLTREEAAVPGRIQASNPGLEPCWNDEWWVGIWGIIPKWPQISGELCQFTQMSYLNPGKDFDEQAKQMSCRCWHFDRRTMPQFLNSRSIFQASSHQSPVPNFWDRIWDHFRLFPAHSFNPSWSRF